MPVDSDGAANALQAWDMLHGNLLLRGWRLSDVSFYTTELPEYMLIELARGLQPDVVHVAGAITFTLLVLLAAMLAKGRRRGREGAVRMGIAAGIMLAPQLGSGVYVLMLDPDHVGTSVPVLLVWLLLDRAPRRWYVPLAVTALLTWAQVADSMATIIGVLPLLVVCGTRCYHRIVTARRPPGDWWFELSVAAGALISAGGGEGGADADRRPRRLPGLAGQLPAGQLQRAAGHLLLAAARAAAALRRRLLRPPAGPGRGASRCCTGPGWPWPPGPVWIGARRFAGRRPGDAGPAGAAVVIDLAGYLCGTRAVDLHSAQGDRGGAAVRRGAGRTAAGAGGWMRPGWCRPC